MTKRATPPKQLPKTPVWWVIPESKEGVQQIGRVTFNFGILCRNEPAKFSVILSAVPYVHFQKHLCGQYYEMNGFPVK